MRARHRIEWLDPAKEDVFVIVDFLIDRAPLVALGLQDVLDKQLDVLENWPRLGQENKYFPDVFDFKIKGLPYVVAYRLAPTGLIVEILAVVHERQNRADPKTYHL
jgi:plasmid stabilization system protein ParE